jgi:hypothetical protein
MVYFIIIALLLKNIYICLILGLIVHEQIYSWIQNNFFEVKAAYFIFAELRSDIFNQGCQVGIKENRT